MRKIDWAPRHTRRFANGIRHNLLRNGIRKVMYQNKRHNLGLYYTRITFFNYITRAK